MSLELEILHALQSWHSPFMDTLMKAFSLMGQFGWIVVAAALCCFKKTRRMGITAIFALIIGVIVGNGILKNLVARARPCWIDDTVKLVVSNPSDFSFPSGHTQASFAVAVSIFLHDKKWGTASLILAALVGLSRMYLFVHFPTDVLAGVTLGIIYAIISLPLAKLALKKSRAWLKARQKG